MATPDVYPYGHTLSLPDALPCLRPPLCWKVTMRSVPETNPSTGPYTLQPRPGGERRSVARVTGGSVSSVSSITALASPLPCTLTSTGGSPGTSSSTPLMGDSRDRIGSGRSDEHTSELQ